MSIRKLIQKTPIVKYFIFLKTNNRAKKEFKQFKDFLKKEDKILDVGAGTCNICALLRNEGYSITPLDIEDYSLIDKLKPIIYDGKKIPFKDNQFDLGLLLYILHHTQKPEEILLETKRCSKKIIIGEDVYENLFHKYLTYVLDSFLNLEIFNHPHSNKTDRQWKDLFKHMGLNIVGVKYRSSYLFLKHATYLLEKA